MPALVAVRENHLPVQFSVPGVPCRTPVHPGYFLQTRYFAPLGLNQTAAAQILGVSRRRINEIIHGHRALSPDTALRCASLLGADAVYLMSLQSAWDVFQTWKKMRQSRNAIHLQSISQR
jgi:addiction module HigA family antidote